MNTLNVKLHLDSADPLLIGRLAYKSGIAYFECDNDFIDSGLLLSPFQLKLKNGIQKAERDPFNGLHGVFADSLPDGWGLLLMDRFFRQKSIPLNTLTPLNRLAYIGDRGMGALSYEPAYENDMNNEPFILSLAAIAEDALEFYQGTTKEVTRELFMVGGSPGGARPKALIGLKGNDAISSVNTLPKGYEYWMVKFPVSTRQEQRAEGRIEYIYSLMATNAHINFCETKPIECDDDVFFSCKRFDRTDSGKRIHMHTMAGLLNANFRIPDSDYESLIKLTNTLTKSHEDLVEIFKRMLFNVMSGNRDDHTKNFSFLMDTKGTWKLSPAYDVTYNHGINGSHSMSIMGEGREISREAILRIASIIPLKEKNVDDMIETVADALSAWPQLAKDNEIHEELNKEIADYMNGSINRLMKSRTVSVPR